MSIWVVLMAKIACLNEEDRKLLFETKQKLDEANQLMSELLETIEVLNDPEMMKAIRKGQDDIKSGRVKELRELLKEDAFWKQSTKFYRTSYILKLEQL